MIIFLFLTSKLFFFSPGKINSALKFIITIIKKKKKGVKQNPTPSKTIEFSRLLWLEAF